MLQSVEMVDNWVVDDEDQGIGSEDNELEVESDGVELLASRREDPRHGDSGGTDDCIVANSG